MKKINYNRLLRTFGLEKTLKGSGRRQERSNEEVFAMKEMSKTELSLLEWGKKVITERPDALEYILKSSNLLDRFIAERIYKTPSGVTKNVS